MSLPSLSLMYSANSNGFNKPEKMQSEEKRNLKRKCSGLHYDAAKGSKLSRRTINNIKDKLHFSVGVKGFFEKLCQAPDAKKELSDADVIQFEQLIDEFVNASLLSRNYIKKLLGDDFYCQLFDWVSQSPEKYNVELKGFDFESGLKTDRLDPEYDVRKEIAVSAFETISEGGNNLEIVITELSVDIPEFIRKKFTNVVELKSDCESESEIEDWIAEESRCLGLA